MSDKKVTKPSNEVVAEVQSARAFDDDALSSIKSFDDAVALAQEEFPVVLADEVLGNGFAVLATDAKRQLIGVPLLFLEWKFNEGEQGKFVSATVVQRLETGGIRKLIINDGSTGIMEQLAAYSNKYGKNGGLLAKRGLRASDYTFTDEKGLAKAATTYYIDTSA